MKLNEILYMQGLSAMLNPSSNLGVKVITPITRQSFDSDQDINYERAKKKKNKELKKYDLKDFNKIDLEKLKIYYNDEEEEKRHEIK